MAQRNEELLDAAVQLFQQNGFYTTSVEDITNACGISKGAFYKHFDSKESMILELLERYYDDMFREADRFAEDLQQSPLSVLKRKITVELEKSIEYRSFFLALATEFSPYEKGQIPEFLDRIQKTHHQWHKQALMDAFGPRVKAYVNDMAVIMEGILHSYLMRIIWRESALPLDRLGDFIAECIKAVVENDDAISPMLPVYSDDESHASIIEGMNHDLNTLRAELENKAERSGSLEKDLQTIDALTEEFTKEKPREFLVDALLTQLHRRSYLKVRTTKIMSVWEVWKGDLT
ncbi:TetR/AcrR family transcriptional regulator [Lentibacillus salicampi]|uniref:TetR/AcrR family transcriptional regulator n=1 Tax=Lentibacillus salicampi TaxID=175306 RepID=A0A4Y9AEW7_9BACI|nr:TetR/AcrR family transcriptional regulator [Lentibacillus salicampi]TFJ94419.1 TetR/AcrR family transcriptional regulator [Lentibacillus salicampi]